MVTGLLNCILFHSEKVHLVQVPYLLRFLEGLGSQRLHKVLFVKMFQLFFFILYTLLATIAFLICKIILYTIRYKWYTSKLDPRIPRMKSLFPIFYYFDTNGAFSQLMEEIKDKNGDFYPIISQVLKKINQ